MDWETLNRLPTLGAAQVTPDGTMIRCNQAFASILGEDQRHLLGKSFITDLTGIEDRRRVEADFTDLLKQAVDSVAHVRTIQRPDGTSTGASVCAVIPSGQPDILYFIWRQAQTEDLDKLKAHNQQLEQLLALVLKNANAVAPAAAGAGVVFNVAGADRSRNYSASGGGSNTVGSHNSSITETHDSSRRAVAVNSAPIVVVLTAILLLLAYIVFRIIP